MSGYSMTAIDTDSGQLVEVPVDPNATYVIQDSGAILSGGHVQLGGLVSSGKSILKPELAQHLIQPIGYKSSVTRGGFTQSIVDPRMTQAIQRGSRVLPRKPVGSSSMQVIGGCGGLVQHSAALAPTASGLLSLGTRYTPPGGCNFGGTGGGGTNLLSGLVSSAGTVVQGGTIIGSGGMSDRLAAAMTGASSRGRPRGRRPLRGQFPVVPIDMVRQLGIEQQVILQPAAPVAMRNKCILTRPLQMSRKTQASSLQRESACQTESDTSSSSRDPMQAEIMQEEEEEEDDEDSDLEPPGSSSKKESEGLLRVVESDISQTSDDEEEEEGEDRAGIKWTPAHRLDMTATQTEHVETTDTGTETNELIEEEEDEEAVTPPAPLIQYVPLPVPIPVYVPIPFFGGPKPVPFPVLLPIPFVVPLPLPMRAQEQAMKEDRGIDVQIDLFLEKPPQMKEEQVSLSVTASRKRDATSEVLASKRPRLESESSNRRPTAGYHLKFCYGINAWRHWAGQNATSGTRPRLRTELLEMTDDDLNTALSQFVHEVRKPNGESYVADSIFYFCLGIQEYLNENGRPVNLFGSPTFRLFARALNRVLADFQPPISSEGILVCRIEEEHLWEARQLGDMSPSVLLFTIIYFNTKHFCLREGSTHRELKFANFRLQKKTLCFVPDSQSSRDDGDASDVYPVFENIEQSNRCPVLLHRLYVEKCPASEVSRGGSFCLMPLSVENSALQWYSSTPVSTSDIQVMLNRIKMVKEIQLSFMDYQPD